ncbi:MAG: cell division protein ZapA [Chitinophagaceae bacterium]|nr:cell division protein ZapA [Chitinophagaceae bacterium]
MSDQLIPLNILIGDRSYRIKSLPKDEEVIRKTLKTINDKITEFKTQFSGKDMQDYIAMVLIWFATQNPPAEGNGQMEKELIETLKKFEIQIDKVL